MEKDIMYDWLIVGAGLAGAVFAREMTDRGYKCLVIDKRPHYGGNCYCEQFNGVITHKYGAHIFHTSSQKAWDYFVKYAGDIRKLGIYAVQAKSGGEIYPLPFNMNTFAKIWPDVCTPAEARKRISEQAEGKKEAQNLEDSAIMQVGRDVYEKLIKGYTEKQWGKSCTELPPKILGRIPVRFYYDNNYYYCDKIGIPENGYNTLFDNLLKGIEVRLCCDFTEHRGLEGICRRVFYTAPIDALMGYEYGRLEYRSLRFETKVRELSETQGCPVVNYCDASVPYTRIIEHNQFAPSRKAEELVVSLEFPQAYEGSAEPYYPIPTEQNKNKYSLYSQKAREKFGDKFIFGGRLGTYRYFAMDDTILDTLNIVETWIMQKEDI